MQVLFDKVKYEMDEKEVRKTYRIPTKVIKLLTPMLFVSLFLVGVIIAVYYFNGSDFLTVKHLVIFNYCYTTIILFGMCMAKHFKYPCPANAQYGDIVMNSTITSKGVKFINDKPHLYLVAEPINSKEKTKKQNVHYIPLIDMGFFDCITEEYVDVNVTGSACGYWYKPLQPHIEELQRTAYGRKIPFFVLEAEKKRTGRAS